jgi:hypothetical protein
VTLILLVVGIIAVMIFFLSKLLWVIPIIAGLIAIATLRLSIPKFNLPAYITALFIIITAGGQAYDSYNSYLLKQEMQTYAFTKLHISTHRYLKLIRDMIFFGSDGWLPRDEHEFFSIHSAKIICENLNLDASPQVVPKRSWRNWIAENSKDYSEQLSEIISAYSQYLNDDIIKKIAAVESSFTLLLSEYLPIMLSVDKELGFHRIPIIGKGVVNEVYKDLLNIKSLYIEIEERKDSLPVPGNWSFLSMKTDKMYKRNLLGRDKFVKP